MSSSSPRVHALSSILAHPCAWSWAPYLRRPSKCSAFFMSAHSRTKVLSLSARPCALEHPGASMRLVLGTIFKKAEQMLGFFYVCPLEDQGPLALRASMRSRASWRIHAPGPGHHI